MHDVLPFLQDDSVELSSFFVHDALPLLQDVDSCNILSYFFPYSTLLSI